MCIVLIGGHNRMEYEYKTIADKCGHDIKIFTHLTPRFNKSIGKPDAIVLFTSTVSHKMVTTAVKEAKKRNIALYRSHTSSGSALKSILKQLESNVC